MVDGSNSKISDTVNGERLVYTAYYVVHIHTGGFWVTTKKKADNNVEEITFLFPFW